MMESTEFMLSEPDARSLVRLLAEVAASRLDHLGMKRLLMTRLANLIGADAWMWTLGCRMEQGDVPIYLSAHHGGFDPDRYARFLTAAHHPDMGSLTASIIAEMRQSGAHVTRVRQRMADDATFQKSAAFPFWQAADIGSLILSLRPIDSRSVSSVGLYRRKDAREFSDRESRIAHVVLSEVPWLHEMGWPEDRGATVPELPPKTRLVLNLLLDGRGKQQIAAYLAISENTVSGYQKEIYRYFRVRSHAELLSRFR